LPVLTTTSGQKKLFQAYRKVNVARVAKAGTLAGRKMRVRMAQREAPSISAASSISFGIVMKNWRIRVEGGREADETIGSVHLRLSSFKGIKLAKARATRIRSVPSPDAVIGEVL